MVATKDGAGLFSPLADERTRLGRRLEERCRETLGDQDNQLAEALYHALASPGKFVRSLLMLDVAWLSVVSEMLGHALAALPCPPTDMARRRCSDQREVRWRASSGGQLRSQLRAWPLSCYKPGNDGEMVESVGVNAIPSRQMAYAKRLRCSILAL